MVGNTDAKDGLVWGVRFFRFVLVDGFDEFWFWMILHPGSAQRYLDYAELTAGMNLFSWEYSWLCKIGMSLIFIDCHIFSCFMCPSLYLFISLHPYSTLRCGWSALCRLLSDGGSKGRLVVAGAVAGAEVGAQDGRQARRQIPVEALEILRMDENWWKLMRIE